MDRDKGFLEALAGRYFKAYGAGIRDAAFVFPNRRSSVYFRHYLAALSDTPLWSPAIFSINDLIRECSGLEVWDTYELIFQLYDIYRQQVPKISIKIENFFQTGKTILSDLNDIDKNMVPTEELFRSLKDLHGLEDPRPSDTPAMKKEYLDFWFHVENIYVPFRESLESVYAAYEGMAFRKVAENPDLIRQKGWEKIIFAGFNALSGSERSIISQLRDSGTGTLIVEADAYFMNDPDQEAGFFLRKNHDLIDEDHIIHSGNGGLSGVKNIEIIEATTDAAIVKYTGFKLGELINSGESPEDTAVILPDENILFPVINSLPETTGRGNISLGYPLKQTTVFSLYESLVALHSRKSILPARKDLLGILEHPYIKMVWDKETEASVSKLKMGTGTFVEFSEIEGERAKQIVSGVENSSGLLELIINILDLLRTEIAVKGIRLSGLEKEFIYRFHSIAAKMNGIIRRTGDPVSLKGFHKMFNDMVGAVHIPFTGEPLEGLQVMGVLEMQNLKFRNIFLLSMNEDKFPAGKHSPTFIPQDVRRKFDLPVHGEREAVYAYHFYRMLANSENITLLFSGERTGTGSGERSRFIDQVLLEYTEYNPRAKITRTSVDFDIDLHQYGEITVPKTGSSLEKIGQMGFSPTSLRTWLECPLRFWFRYVLGIRDTSDSDDPSDPAIFGIIVHSVLEKIYKGREGKNTSEDFFDGIRPEQTELIIRETFSEKGIREVKTGLNHITFEVIRKFTEAFLKAESEDAPVTILSLENKIDNLDFTFETEKGSRTVRLKGIIDRIDRKDGITRIIDYKTGKVDKLSIDGEIAGMDFVKHKEIFQLLFYTLLLENTGKLDNGFKLGIYPFKTLSQGLTFAALSGEELLPSTIIGEFKAVLASIFSNIFDPDIPFTQTGDEKNCRYCLHKNICERQAGTDRF